MKQLVRPVVIAAVGIALAGPEAARAEPVQCGQLVTQDVVLEADLLDCPGDGLVVAAPDVTVDMARHRVDGTGSGVGIRVQAPSATISDGSVTGFGDGIALPSGGVGDSLVADVDVSGSVRSGILLGACGSDGQPLPGVAGALAIRRTGVTGNAGAGIRARCWIDETRVRRSRIAGNGLAGISFTNSSRGPRIALNRIVDNGGGVTLDDFSGGATVVGNLIDGNANFGVFAFRSGVTLRWNTVTHNGTPGVFSGGAFLEQSVSVVEDNRFDHNVGSGLSLSENVPELRARYAINRNTAIANTEWGIFAAEPGFSGSGNIARRNGQRAQCFNFDCRR